MAKVRKRSWRNAKGENKGPLMSFDLPRHRVGLVPFPAIHPAMISLSFHTRADPLIFSGRGNAFRLISR